MRHAAQTVEQAPVNSALLNVVTPMGLSFEKNRLSIGENIGKAYGIIRYPQKVDVEWLSKLTNIPSTLVSIGFKPVDNGTLINAISRSVVQQRGLADGDGSGIVVDSVEGYNPSLTFTMNGGAISSANGYAFEQVVTKGENYSTSTLNGVKMTAGKTPAVFITTDGAVTVK